MRTSDRRNGEQGFLSVDYCEYFYRKHATTEAKNAELQTEIDILRLENDALRERVATIEQVFFIGVGPWELMKEASVHRWQRRAEHQGLDERMSRLVEGETPWREPFL